MKMLYRCGRRRSRPRFVKVLITLTILIIISFLIRSDVRRTGISNGNDSQARLFCVLLSTQTTHEQFVYMSNRTWAKQCDRIGIVRYRRLQKPDAEVTNPQSPHHVNLWTRILDTIRQSISSYDYIFNNDVLVIVPASAFVFGEKLFSLFHSSPNNSLSPLIIIHEQQEANAYILNGQALNLVRNTDLIDLCLQQSYPSARESHLWKCVQTSMQSKQTDVKCDHKNCFIQYQHDQLSLAHIKNGFCLQNNLHMCQTIALMYPITINDMITLEFFKYRLKPKSSDDFL